jgi:hypothetical protein
MGVKCQFKKFHEGKVHFMRSSVNVKYFGGGGGGGVKCHILNIMVKSANG